MKKMKRILVTILGLISLLTIGLVRLGNNEVIASTTSKLDVSYKVYDANSYKILGDFETVYGYSYETAKSEIDTYAMYIEYAQSAPEDFGLTADTASQAGDMWWAGDFLDQSADYEGTYATLGTLPETTFTYGKVPNKKTVTVEGAGYTYDAVKASVDSYNNVKPLTSVSPGQRIVIQPVVNLDGGSTDVAQVVICVDGSSFIDTSQTIKYYKTQDALNASNYPGNVNAGAALPSIGFTYAKGATYASGDAISCGGIELTLSQSLSSSITIGMVTGPLQSNSGFTDADYTSVTYNTNTATRFQDNKLTLSVESGDDTTLSSLTVGGTDILSTAETTNIGSKDYTSYTAGSTNASSVSLVPTPTSGTVTSVNYSTTLANALTGTAATASGNAYSIDMSGVSSGESMYVAVTVLASDGTSEETYIVEIPKAADTSNTLDGISFIADGATTNVKIYSSATMDTEISFSSNITEYWLGVASTASNILATPILNSPKTGTITGTTGNFVSGTQYTIALTNNKIEIVVSAQDSSVATKKYTFTIVPQSTDTSVTAGTLSVPSPLSVSYDAATKKFTISGLGYGDTAYSLTPSLLAGQSCKIDGTSVTSNTPINKTFTLTSGNYNSQTNNFSFVVESEYGTTETYTVEVQMDAADTDTTVSKVYVVYTDPNGGNAEHLLTNDNGNYSIKGVPYTVSDYKIMIVLPDGSKQTIGYNTTSFSAANTALSSNVQSSSITFTGTGAVTSTVYVTVTAQNQTMKNTFTITVEREAPSDDVTLETVSIKDNNNKEIGVWDADNQTYTINGNLPFSMTSVTVTAKANDAYAIAKINGTGTTTLVTKTYTYSTSSFNEETATFVITVEAQDGSSGTPLTIEVVRSAADNTIDYTIVATDSAGQSIAMTTAADYKTSTSADLEYETTSVKFTLTPVKSTTTYWINGVDYTNREYTYSLSETIKDRNIFSVTVLAKTEGDSAGENITISFVRKKAEDNTNIAFTIEDVFGNIYPVGKTDGNKRTYVIDDEIAGPNFKINATGYSSKSSVYTSTDLNNLTVNPYSVDDTYAIAGKSVYLTVVSQYGTKVTYEIITEKPDKRSQDASIASITVAGTNVGSLDPVFSSSVYKYTVKVPFTTTSVTITVMPNHSAASLITSGNSIYNGMAVELSSNGTKNLSVGPNYFYYEVKAENDSITSGVYCIEVQRTAGLTDDYIETLKINGIDCTTLNQTYFATAFDRYMTTGFAFVLPRTASSIVNPTIDLTVSSGAVFEILTVGVTGSQTATPYRPSIPAGSFITVQVNVKSETAAMENGQANIYTFNLYVADQDASVSNVKILDKQAGSDLMDTNNAAFVYNSAVVQQTKFTVPYSVSTAYIDILPTASNYAVITGDYKLQSLNVGTNTFTAVVHSEYDDLNSAAQQTKTITIVIEREAADTENKLKELSVIIDGVEYITSFNPASTDPIKLENIPDSATSVEISASPLSSKSTVSGTGSFTLDLISNNSQTFSVSCQSEDASINPRTYKIIIAKKEIVLDKNTAISDITAMDSTGKDYIEYSTAKAEYSVNLTGSTASVNVTVIPGYTGAKIYTYFAGASSSVAPVYSDYNELSTGTGQFTAAVTPGESKVYYVICQAENGDYGTAYKLTISRAALNKDATANTLTMNGTAIPGFTPSNSSYTIYVPNTTLTAYLGANPTETTSSITSNDAPQSAPYTLAVGSNVLTLTITAEDPNETKTYTVTVIRDAENTLSDLEVLVDGVNGISYTDGTLTYTVSPNPLSYEIDFVTVIYTTTATSGVVVEISYKDATGKIIKLTTNNAVVPVLSGENTITISVKPASVVNTTDTTQQKDYTVTVYREEGSKDAYIEKYITEDGTELALSKNTFKYSYAVAKGTLTYNPTITFSAKATFTDFADMDRTLSTGIANVKTITVTSQDGTTVNTYTFNVYVADTNADSANDPMISDINVLDKAGGSDICSWDPSTNSYTANYLDYDASKTSYTLTVPYSLERIYLEVLTNKSSVVVKKSNTSGVIGHSSYITYANAIQSLAVGTNEFYLYAVSEYGVLNPNAANETTSVYRITIIREAANSDATLKELTISYIDDSGQPQTKTATAAELLSQEFILENIGNNVTSITIGAVPSASSTKVTGTGLKKLAIYNTTDGTGYTFPFTVETEAEDGSKLSYTVTVSRGPVDLDSDKTLNFIQLMDSNGIEYLGQAGQTKGEEFSLTKERYSYTIPYGAQSFTISADKLNVSPAKIYIYEASKVPAIATSGSVQYSIQADMYGTTKEYVVYVRSQNNEDSTHYSIELTFEAPSTDATLKSLTADGATVTGFTPTDEGGTYTLTIRPNSVSQIVIDAVVNDTKAKLTGIGQFALNVGDNTFVVVVTAEDGSANTFTIHVVRDYPEPYLTDLDVVGEQLLGENDKAIVFDKDTKTYHVIVTYMTLSATIHASVDNVANLVSCSNATVDMNTGLTRSFQTTLAEGINSFTITVTSTEGKRTEYKLIIQRRGLASTNTNIASVLIEEIQEFNDSYTNMQTVYGDYTVENKIRNLNVKVVCEKIADIYGDGATYQVFNEKNLQVGLNKVIILVTAEDGETTRAVVVNVIRRPMEFTVNENATDFKTTKDTGAENKYVIDLKNKDASAIEDYTKYIVFDAEDNLEVKVLSDTKKKDCTEVIVSVSDGSEERLVTFQLQSSAVSSTSFSVWLWVILGIILILLIIILICVNRDKYGTILKKRKRMK